ncbi:hypothetical protein F5Y09DRAFT_334024 [Xylaria sp. FL1042]|nr:hypothetical protein F5Y09DRAFT_334024 [Xylaria sp. FL1042]
MNDWFKELENAVCNVIQIIKQIPELADTKLAVVGDLALWRYLPAYRSTNSIDIITNSPAVNFLKWKLVDHPNSPFTQKKQVLSYRSPAGWDIPINISSQRGSHSLPEPEHLVYDLPYGEVPYISLEDLTLVKLSSSYSKTTNRTQRRQDADDAAALLDHKLARQSPTQRAAWVEENLRAYKSRIMESTAVPMFQRVVSTKQALCDVHTPVVSVIEVPVLET